MDDPGDIRDEVVERFGRNIASEVTDDRAVGSRPNDELYGKPWYDKWPKGRMIQFNSSSPYANARGRIRKWLKSTT